MSKVPNRRIAIMAAVVLSLGLSVACRGSSETADAPQGSLTDPASVPTSTPISGGVVYKITSDGISVEGASRTATPGSNGPGAGTTYIVQSGDTCGAIATKFEITVAELRAANIRINAGCTNIQPDEVLRIPALGSSSQPTPSGSDTGGADMHTVLEGQNCGNIADLNGITLAELLSANGMTEDDCTTLQIGQVLQLP